MSVSDVPQLYKLAQGLGNDCKSCYVVLSTNGFSYIECEGIHLDKLRIFFGKIDLCYDLDVRINKRGDIYDLDCKIISRR